ncbi:MAG: hypothetical protein IJK91_07720 [Bacteroidales bacterium]|nr:hypothetical protein [Bacteroidales bacterium]
MKKIVLLLVAAALSFACNKADIERVERLQRELDELQRQTPSGVPAAADIVVDPQTPFAFTFDKERYGVDAGSSVTINYSLPETATVEVSPREGWGVSVNSSGATGQIVVTAPDPASPAMFSGQKSFG